MAKDLQSSDSISSTCVAEKSGNGLDIGIRRRSLELIP